MDSRSLTNAMVLHAAIALVIISCFPPHSHAQVKINENHALTAALQFIYSHSDVPEVLNNNIYYGRNRIGLQGAINSFTSYKVSMQSNAGFTFGIIDFYGSIDSPLGEIRIGQFKPPFSMERLISFPNRDFVPIAIATDLTPKRDLGVGLFSTVKNIDVNLALLNGSGYNKPENNSYKDVVARLLVKPIQYVHLGGALYLGKSGPDSSTYNRTLYNLQGEVMAKGFTSRAEYVRAKEGGVKGYCYYLQGGYRIKVNCRYLQELEPLLRYEKHEPDAAQADDQTQAITAAVNLYIDGYKMRVQLNYLNKTLEGNGDENLFYLLTQFML